MTALVAAIEARVAELRKDVASGLPWLAVGEWVAGYVGHCTCDGGYDYPHRPECEYEPLFNVGNEDAARKIVTAVNLLPALLDHIERVVQRHTPTYCCPPEKRAGCPWPNECASCTADEDWPCPDLTSAATAVGIDPALREDPT